MQIRFAVVALLFAGLPASAQLAPHSTPMEVVHGKPYVQVTLNGKGPFRFMVDTGTSGEALVTPALAGILQLPQTGTTQLNDPTGLGGQSAPVRLIDTLTVAGVDFYAIRAVEHPMLPGDTTCDGMLGFTLFQGLLLTLDYPAGRLVLENGDLKPDGDHSVHAFRMPDGIPITTITIGELKVDALIDSGGAGLNLPERLAPQLKFSTDPETFGRAQSLATRFDFKVGKLATDVHFGDITLDQPWVELNPAFPTANFGSVPLQHFTVTFDQENLLLRIDGPQKHITLGVTPTPLQLTNQPPAKPPDPTLVPIG